MNEPRIPTEDREPLPALDRVTAERLLDGRLDGGCLPPAYAAVRNLLQAARSPALPSELAAEAAAVAAFRARPLIPTRRPRVLAKVLTVKAAVVAASALSVAGVAAAATGSLPGSGDRPTVGAAAAAGSPTAQPAGDLDRSARLALCEAAAHRGGSAEAKPAAAALARLAGGAGAVEAYCADAASAAKPDAGRGPDAAGAAKQGLCRAAAAGEGAQHGGKAAAVAFEALAQAAGGPDQIKAYCAGPVAGHPSTAADRPAPAIPSAGAPTENAGDDARPTDLPSVVPSVVPSPSHPRGRP